jgi:hypothetical protein
VVVVDADGTLVRVGSLGQGLPIATGAASEAADTRGAGPVGADSSGGIAAPAPVSLYAFASLMALSVLATVLRRRLVRRRLRVALIARLAGLPARAGRARAIAAVETPAPHAPAEHESA